MSHPVNTMSSSLASGTKSRISGVLALGAFAQADGPHLRQRPDGLGESLADRLYAGDESGADRSHADRHDSEFPFGWLNARRAWRSGSGCRHALLTLLYCNIGCSSSVKPERPV